MARITNWSKIKNEDGHVEWENRANGMKLTAKQQERGGKLVIDGTVVDSTSYSRVMQEARDFMKRNTELHV